MKLLDIKQASLRAIETSLAVYPTQEQTDATRIGPTSSHAEADDTNGTVSTPLLPSRRVILPRLRPGEGKSL